MDIRNRLKRVFSPNTIPGWAIVIWKTIDAIDNAAFATRAVDDVWDFLTSPVGDIIVIVIGLGLIFLAVLRPDWSWYSLVRAPAKPDDSEKVDYKEPWVRYFDRLFTMEINTMVCRNLWNDAGTGVNMEPFLIFNLVVVNNTAITIYITGCEGQATIDGDLCTFPMELQTPGQIRIDPWHQLTPTIKQSLQTDKGRELAGKIEAKETIRFSLGTAKFLVEDSDGAIPNRPIAVSVSFEVDPTGISLEQSGVTKRSIILKNP